MKNGLTQIVELVRVCLPYKATLRLASLKLRRDTYGPRRRKPAIALESGFHFLLEGGGRILLEKEGTKVFDPIPKSPVAAITLENGSKMLLENGGMIKLEETN